MLEKNIFLLWFQGWDKAPWLPKIVSESWKFNNPDWKVHLLDMTNLHKYMKDSDYITDRTKNITVQALSDIVRLNVLKHYGGVWADATMLCMQPLDHWAHTAVEPAGLWMYHGHGGKMPKEDGPASWFILSKKGDYMITKWKDACDAYWKEHTAAHTYFWMDSLFKNLFETDPKFKEHWSKAPYLYCELDGQSHTLAHHKMEGNTPHLKQLFLEKPPYALKFWSYWNNMFSGLDDELCKNTNGHYAMQMAFRKFCYTHEMV